MIDAQELAARASSNRPTCCAIHLTTPRRSAKSPKRDCNTATTHCNGLLNSYYGPNAPLLTRQHYTQRLTPPALHNTHYCHTPRTTSSRFAILFLSACRLWPNPYFVYARCITLSQSHPRQATPLYSDLIPTSQSFSLFDSRHHRRSHPLPSGPRP